jgi:hypothetical protein
VTPCAVESGSMGVPGSPPVEWIPRSQPSTVGSASIGLTPARRPPTRFVRCSSGALPALPGLRQGAVASHTFTPMRDRARRGARWGVLLCLGHARVAPPIPPGGVNRNQPDLWSPAQCWATLPGSDVSWVRAQHFAGRRASSGGDGCPLETRDSGGHLHAQSGTPQKRPLMALAPMTKLAGPPFNRSGLWSLASETDDPDDALMGWFFRAVETPRGRWECHHGNRVFDNHPNLDESLDHLRVLGTEAGDDFELFVHPLGGAVRQVPVGRGLAPDGGGRNP